MTLLKEIKGVRGKGITLFSNFDFVQKLWNLRIKKWTFFNYQSFTVILKRMPFIFEFC